MKTRFTLLLAGVIAFCGGFWMHGDTPVPRDANQLSESPVSQVPNAGERTITQRAQVIRREPSNFLRSLSVLELCKGAGPGQLRTLLDHFINDKICRELIARRWAELDPSGLLAYIQEVPYPGEPGVNARTDLESVLFQVWTRNDPDEAFEQALKHPMPNGQYWGFMTVFDTIQDIDVDRALKMIAESGNTLNSFRPGKWMTDEPAAAIRKVAALPDGTWKGMALRYICDSWAKLEPEKAIDAYSALTLPRDRLGTLVETWLNKDFDAAKDWVENQATGKQQAELSRQVATAWAKTDPDAALDWVNSNLQGKARREALGGLLKTLANSNIEDALTFFEKLPTGSTKDYLVADVTSVWAGKEPEAAAKWLETLPDRSNRREAYERLVNEWSRQDIDRLTAYVKQSPDVDGVEVLAYYTANELASDRTPKEAVEWMQTLSDTKRSMAVPSVMNTWSRSDPQQAADYVMKLDGELRYQSLEHVGFNFMNFRPEDAISWAKAIDDPSDRRAIQNGLRNLPKNEEIIARLGWDK
ncbi:MAG: hypothetical protein KDN22_27665 [Verrucomicrobiae bacterium]|nr:hypothetical protein [Verrucomicrobiae bacterium]